jgi:uncharacterized protein YjbI with pentapeptide repeats
MLLEIHGMTPHLALCLTCPTSFGAPARPSVGASGSPSWLPVAGAIGAVVGACIAGGIGFANSWYTLRKQRALTELTLDEQRRTTQEALDHQRERLFNERFATAADKLGHAEAATRMAGVYAFAGLADDWAVQRQTCIDVLCGYMRLPNRRIKGTRGDTDGESEVRLSLIRAVRDHLRESADTPWRGQRFRFHRVCFTDGDLSEIVLPDGGYMSFYGAQFQPGYMDFRRAQLRGCTVDFNTAKFLGGIIDFRGATLAGSRVKFQGATLSNGSVIDFRGATFLEGSVEFDQATLSEGRVDFQGARFSGGTVDLAQAVFCGAIVDLSEPGVYSTPAGIPDSLPAGLLLPRQVPNT